LPHLEARVTYLARNTATARRKALGDAMADARDRAEALAWAAGLQLGTIREIHDAEDSSGGTISSAEAADHEIGPSEIEPHHVTIEGCARVVWSLTM